MTAAEPFLRVALLALDEVGELPFLGDTRAILDGAIREATPLVSLHKPANAKKVIEWAATQMAMSADNPARAYSRLRELLAALFEPIAGHPLLTVPAPVTAVAPIGGRPSNAAPAPEVAMAMPPAALLDALAPPPRVLARVLASSAKLDVRALLAGPFADRVLAIRSIPQASIGSFASELAAAIADPELRREAIEICAPAADKTRAKVAEALQPLAVARDGNVRAAAIEGIHALRFQLDDEALLAALADPTAAVRAAAARTIGTGRRGYAPAIEQRVVALIADPDEAVRIAALGAIVRFPSLLSPALIEPLRESAGRSGDEAKTAVFLLGRLGAQANTAVIEPRVTTEAPSRLEGSPRELEEHGAYVIGALDKAIGVWDRGTGRQLFVVAGAELLAFIPSRAEVAVVRIEKRKVGDRGRTGACWYFERHLVPTGARVGSLPIPAQLTHGTPSQLSIAADLATLWCDAAEPYRFHIKLGEPDVVIDATPIPGRPSRKA